MRDGLSDLHAPVNHPIILVRPIDPQSSAEIALVAERMRLTLIEVEGPEVGGSMYTIDWLVDRVRFHLDPARSEGAVFVAAALGSDGQDIHSRVVGHTIVRVESEPERPRFGLFSTTYVAPSRRRSGVAGRLLARGEEWMIARSLPSACTWTSASNQGLIRLYEGRGYSIVESAIHEGTGTRMVRLERPFTEADIPPPPGALV